MATKAISRTEMPALNLVARGKVRDIYDLGESLLLVATDRISAFDVVFPDAIPGKGQVLTQISAHWFGKSEHIVRNHSLGTEVDDLPVAAQKFADQLEGRAMLCRKAKPMPIECVVRGYLDGSAWKEYQKGGLASGHNLPSNLQQRSRLPEPIFTPSTKAEQGHDENITEAQAANLIGKEAFEYVRRISIELFNFGHDQMAPKGIILGDTKFEFGWLGDDIILIDECMTPDSSRFWQADTYFPGPQKAISFDKQFVRDYVEEIGWNKQAPAPTLPEDVIAKTTERYEKISALIRD